MNMFFLLIRFLLKYIAKNKDISYKNNKYSRRNIFVLRHISKNKNSSFYIDGYCHNFSGFNMFWGDYIQHVR